jgi:hypothetical protein
MYTKSVGDKMGNFLTHLQYMTNIPDPGQVEGREVETCLITVAAIHFLMLGKEGRGSLSRYGACHRDCRPHPPFPKYGISPTHVFVLMDRVRSLHTFKYVGPVVREG